MNPTIMDEICKHSFFREWSDHEKHVSNGTGSLKRFNETPVGERQFWYYKENGLRSVVIVTPNGSLRISECLRGVHLTYTLDLGNKVVKWLEQNIPLTHRHIGAYLTFFLTHREEYSKVPKVTFSDLM